MDRGTTSDDKSINYGRKVAKSTVISKSASVTGYAFPAEVAKKRLNELMDRRRTWVEKGYDTDSPGYHDMEGWIEALKWLLTR